MINCPMQARFQTLWICLGLITLARWGLAEEAGAKAELAVVGVNIVPHEMAPGMRYRRDPEPRLGARLQWMVQNVGSHTLILGTNARPRLNSRMAAELLEMGELAWHDLPEAWPTAVELPPGAVTVWNLNGRTENWRPGRQIALDFGELLKTNVVLKSPRAEMTAITFLGAEEALEPDRVVIHIANKSPTPLKPVATTLWLPEAGQTFRAMLPKRRLTEMDVFGDHGLIPAGDKGIVEVHPGKLPLTHAAIELELETPDGESFSVWAHLRVKPERFDIGGGWVGGEIRGKQALTFEPFLKTLKGLHVNTAHIAETPGYTDSGGPEGLYSKYPLKYFNKLQPLEHFDTDRLLPRIHAVEFLGEPQYGGGRPVPPMIVWRELSAYAGSRLATTVTHSEERIWRDYAGLSDFPHFDAYRISAPSPDAWKNYDRWGGARIGWGAPLETIGAMTRSLRELNRPMPVAYWSQGPHEGWGVYDGRKRTSPTPDELRLQAWHALAQRVTSLYWFNLSWGSLIKFPDLIPEMRRVGREAMTLGPILLEGDAYEHRQMQVKGKPSWDLASVASGRALLLVALDLDYKADPVEKVFRFGPPRQATFRFKLPAWLAKPVNVHRFDADGLYDCEYYFRDGSVEIRERASRVAIFVVEGDVAVAAELHRRRKALVDMENSLDFDPGQTQEDLATLMRGP